MAYSDFMPCEIILLERDIPESPLADEIAYVDECDYERALQYRWTVQRTPNVTYVTARVYERGPRTHLHVFIHGPARQGYVIDHIDRNGLMNTRINLREVSKAHNSHNSALSVNNKSGYKGVSYCAQTGKWCASITSEGKYKRIGRYATPEEAARAYDSHARLRGSDTYLNFP